MSPKQTFVRSFKRAMVVDLIFLCVLYATTSNDQQMLANHLMAILSFFIVALFAFYRAAGVEHQQYGEWIAEQKAAIHYPLRSSFDSKVNAAEGERRKYRFHEVA